MGFVNEYVSDEDKRNVLFTRNNPFPPDNNEILRPFKWTIDRERDFILDAVGLNNPEMWDRFVFQWKGELGAVMAQKSVVKEPSKSNSQGFVLDTTWTMRVLHVPIANSDKTNEIKLILSEAFEAYEQGGCGPIRTVRVIWDDCGVVVGGGYVTL